MPLHTKIAPWRTAVAGLLGALALLLSFLEGSLPPLPLMPPGAKPGLSNLVTMYAAESLGLPYALFIAFLKGSFALFTRGVSAGIMSLSGGLLSALLLTILLRKTHFSCVCIGILGALVHNLAQGAVSLYLMGSAALYYLPALLFFGVLSGILTGLCYHALSPLLRRVPWH